MDNRHGILQLLRCVADGSASPEEALSQLKREPFADLGYAKVDLHRGVRQGAAEVIYGAGKTPEQIAGIAASMGERGCQNILITRLGPEAADAVARTVPLDYYPVPKLAVAFPGERSALGHIVVATGGTSDMPVAEEAALTAEALGNRVTRLYDVGVAGLHRLLGTLFSFKLDAQEKLDIIGREYEIPIETNIRKEVDSMCSLGQEIREQGRMEGRTEGVAEIIMNMYQTGFSLKQIADIAKKTTDEVKAIVETKKTVLS